MAKQRRNINLSPLFEDMKDRFLKLAVNISVLAIFIIVAVLLVQAFLYRSDYFKVCAVDTKDIAVDARAASYISNQILKVYRGRNIFTVDLRAIASAVRARFPDAKEVVVGIALPDKLTVNMKFRRAVALVRGAKLYPVDDDGVVLLNANSALFKFLPTINGIEIRSGERTARRGAPYRDLKIALELLREVRQSRFLAGYSVVNIDASDIKALSFTLKGGVRVRIGFENFKARLDTLKKVLDDPRMAMDRIDYIDVRFKDVVIGPRED